MKCTEKEQETCEFEKRGCEGCAYNEKSADEMFAELGYKLTLEDDERELVLEYTKNYKQENFNIRFWNDRTVNKISKRHFEYLTMQELQAIYQKCKEMRWIA